MMQTISTKRNGMLKSAVLGLTAAAASILLWLSFNFANLYAESGDNAHAVLIRTCWTLLLPAVLAAGASWFAKPYLLLASFIWSLPISLYLACTPGIYALFGLTSAAYLIAYLMMRSGW
ncbi:hypothetical protein GZH47_03045 [Paenibacillus rhizovicinus]|uniref:Uncharacterized protein n=1 Tax=Paenibacillus rhizovicinus TaxID=2704463 RepID=A0A6C0NUP0_9BACL|nr:hypothetical protein [Paenibacillus rhizovicinus]QHW29910.1 hypothetical protein GZH47_03045 [Paenibacillus rhizovicinus]